MIEIFNEIKKERIRQDEKWGIQNHSPETWFLILGEEIGEAQKAVLENDLPKYREEMVQVVAVAVAMIECFDRNEW